MPGPQFARQPHRARNVDARRCTKTQPLVADQIEHGSDRFGIGDPEGVIDREPFEICGNAALADAFGHRTALARQFARRVITEQCGAGRIGYTDRDVRLALAQRRGAAR